MSDLKETRYAMSDKAYGLLTPDGKLWPAAGAEEDALYWLIAAAAPGDVTPEAVRAKLEAIGYRTTLVDITIAAPPTDNLEAGAGDLVAQKLLKSIDRGMDYAGTLTAKDAVKVRPVDWHEIIDAAREAAAQLSAVTAENARLRELADRLKLEAQCHAGEARGANHTIYEIYQAITGATGEPGNWHGAEPVREYIARSEAQLKAAREHIEQLSELLKIIEEHWIDYDQIYSISVHEADEFCAVLSQEAPK